MPNVRADVRYPRRMSPNLPHSPTRPQRRVWPIVVLCLAVVAGIVAVVLVKTCPPTPIPAGHPAPAEAPVVDAKAEPVPEASKALAPIVVEVPPAPAVPGKAGPQ